MTPASAALLLRRAADAVEVAAASLDGSWRSCSCCDLKVFHNKPEANLKRSLEGDARKLRQSADKLEAGLQSESRGENDE